MNAQLNEPCATPESSGSDLAGVYSYSDDLPTLENFTPMVFNVFFWGINKNDGTSNYPLTETTALSAVAKLNIEYNSFGIFFKYYGMDFFNSDTYYETDRGEIHLLFDYTRTNNLRKPEAFNIYVPYETTNFAGAAETKNKVGVVVNGFSLINSNTLLSHEVGHCFNLGHTHDNWHNTACEHVTRNPADPNYNAHYRGDNVTDTAAVPDFRYEHYWELIDLGLYT